MRLFLSIGLTSLLILGSNSLGAQVTLAFQGFDGTAADTWIYAPIFQNPTFPQVLVGPGDYGPGYAVSGNGSLRLGGGSMGCASGGGNCINGAVLGGGCNDQRNGNTLLFNTVNTACYKNVQVSIAYRTHILCTSPTTQGQGMDASDQLAFEVSLNGGAFVTIATIIGFDNCTWTYGVVPTTCTSSTAGNPLLYNVPNGTSTVQFRVRFTYNRADEVMYFDNASIQGELMNTTFSYPSPLCTNQGPVLPILSPGFDAFGFFSIPTGLTANSTSGQVSPSLSTPGAYTIQYQVGSTVCSSAPVQVTVAPVTSGIFHN